MDPSNISFLSFRLISTSMIMGERVGTDLLKTNILDQSEFGKVPPFLVSMQCIRSVVQVAKASGELSDVSDVFHDSAMVTNL